MNSLEYQPKAKGAEALDANGSRLHVVHLVPVQQEQQKHHIGLQHWERQSPELSAAQKECPTVKYSPCPESWGIND